MARPCKRRCICGDLKEYSYVPEGMKRGGEPVRLAGDELEALRLADYLGLYQDEAARKMKVSRQTFGRIVESARKKTAGAIIFGRALSVSCCGPVEVRKEKK